MDNIIDKIKKIDISKNKIYQINGIDYTEKEFYKLINKK